MGTRYHITSNGELYHYGVKGMKWGVRKNSNRSKNGATNSATERVPDKNTVSAYSTQKRINKAVLSNMPAAVKLSREYGSATLYNIPATVRYSKKLPALVFNKDNRRRWMTTLNAYMDSINDDVGKITIGKDFFTKHQNDTVNNIINDGTNSMVAYMVVNTASQNSASDNHRRMMGW